MKKGIGQFFIHTCVVFTKLIENFSQGLKREEECFIRNFTGGGKKLSKYCLEVVGT